MIRAISKIGAGALLSALAFSVAGFSAAGAETIRVSVEDAAFSPARVEARVGDTIEWTNVGVLLHTATDRSKTFDLTIPVGKTVRHTIRAAGEIDYFCRFHPNMAGAIVATK